MESKGLTSSLHETLDVFDGVGEVGEPLTTAEVTEQLDVSRRSTYERLERLVDSGYLQTKKAGARGRVWWRPPVDATSDPTRDGQQSTIRPGAEFRALVDAVEEYAIFRLDEEGHVRTWNPGARQINGYESGEIMGKHFSTFYTEEDVAEGVPEANLEAAATQGEIEDEGWRVRADGSRFWANVTITSIRDDGNLDGFAKVTRDMTERHEYEEQLREQRDFTRKVLETTPVGVLLVNADGTFDTVNGRAAELLEIDAEESETVGVNEVYDERGEHLPPRERPYVRVFESGDSLRNVHLAIQTPDGERRWLSTNVEPIPEDDGSFEQALVTIEDVTQLKEQARQLERQRDELERELEDVFERVDDAFFAVDDEWRFTYVNEAAAAMVRLPAGEMLGASVWEMLPDVAEGYPRTRAERAMETQESTEFEFYSETLDIWVEARLYPAENGISVYFSDVTERKERERELEEARRRYQTVVEHFPNGAVALVDDDLRYVTVGGTPVDEAGRTSGALEGQSLQRVLSPELAELLVPRYEDALQGEASSFGWDFGDRYVEFRMVPVRDDDGEVFAAMGMSQDITARKEYERELEKRVSQQQAVTELGQDALETHDLDDLMDEAARLVADVLGNDYCKVLDLDAEREELFFRQGDGWQEGIVGEATVAAVEDDSQAAYTLAVDEPVVVEDLTTEDRFSGPDLLTDHDVRSGISVVVGPHDDPWGILGTHDRDRREFSENDVAFVQSVANILATAIERHDYEHRLVRQREQLAALNGLHEVVRDITDAVVEQSTREEIETAVVEGLAATESFSFAWIGDVDGSSRVVDVRAEAGTGDYLDDITITVDPEDDRSNGPTAQALLTREMQVVHDVPTDDMHDPWRRQVEEYDFGSSAAVPIVYEDTVYGVLNVYADRSHAFEAAERRVLDQLAEVVGHAIAAVERKRALMSDEVVELEYRIQDLSTALGLAEKIDGRITLDQALPAGDDSYLVYGSATPEARPALDAILDTVSHWKSVTDLSQRGGRHRFELRLSEPPVLSVIAGRGGYVDEAVVEDGDYHMTVHLPPTVDVRSVTDVVTEAYPTADLVAQRQFSRTSDAAVRFERLLHEELTERQRVAVEAAYHAGFFEWPRENDGEAVAASLDVSPPTFHQHLRKAERKVFETLLTGGEADA